MPGKTGKPGEDIQAPDLVIQVLYRKHDTALRGTRLLLTYLAAILSGRCFCAVHSRPLIGIQPGFQQPFGLILLRRAVVLPPAGVRRPAPWAQGPY